MGEAALRLERRGGVVRCTLDRPPLNLLEPGLIAALRSTFAALAADPAVRVAIVTGAGRAFTAGMDVRVLRDLDTAGATTLITALHDAIDAVHRAPFPVIAAAPASSWRWPATSALPPPARSSGCRRCASGCRR